MGVVIGNIYDMQAKRTERLRRRAQAVRSSVGYIPMDQSGITVHHEMDPELKADVTQLTQSIRSRGIWVAALGGLLLGLLIGVAIWYAINNARR